MGRASTRPRRIVDAYADAGGNVVDTAFDIGFPNEFIRDMQSFVYGEVGAHVDKGHRRPRMTHRHLVTLRCFYVCQVVIGGCSRSRQTRSGDEPLDAAGGFSFGLAFGDASGDVGLGGRVAALLGDGDEVERPVELTVAAAVEAVPGLVLSGGGGDR